MSSELSSVEQSWAVMISVKVSVEPCYEICVKSQKFLDRLSMVSLDNTIIDSRAPLFVFFHICDFDFPTVWNPLESFPKGKQLSHTEWKSCFCGVVFWPRKLIDCLLGHNILKRLFKLAFSKNVLFFWISCTYVEHRKITNFCTAQLQLHLMSLCYCRIIGKTQQHAIMHLRQLLINKVFANLITQHIWSS